jgi:hypothetical protein
VTSSLVFGKQNEIERNEIIGANKVPFILVWQNGRDIKMLWFKIMKNRERKCERKWCRLWIVYCRANYVTNVTKSNCKKCDYVQKKIKRAGIVSGSVDFLNCDVTTLQCFLTFNGNCGWRIRLVWTWKGIQWGLMKESQM